MSWLTGLAGKAEELLNKVDQSAATALNADDITSSPSTLPSIVTHTETTQISDASKLSSTAFAQNWAPPQTTMSYSGSVPANLNRISAAGRTKLNSKPVAALPPVTTTAAPTTITKNDNKKDMDAELFEFLNSSSTNDSPATGRKRLQTPTGSKHSRQSSASSTTSGKSSRTLDTANTGSADNVDDGSGVFMLHVRWLLSQLDFSLVPFQTHFMIIQIYLVLTLACLYNLLFNFDKIVRQTYKLQKRAKVTK